MDDKILESDAAHLAAKNALELEKLRAEVALAKSQVTFLGNFSRLMWPVITSAVTVGVSLAALIVSLFTSSRQARLQYAQDDQRLLAGYLEVATNDSLAPTRRVASIWALANFWDDEKHERLLAETLSALLGTAGDRTVSMAAAEVIGLAITQSTDESTKVRRAKLLYGSRNGFEVGTVIRQHWFITGSDVNPCEATRDNDDTRVQATREAIRKNWEYLRGAHLKRTDLTGIRLYAADLTDAYLVEAKLDKADLRGAHVQGASLTDSCVRGANIEGLVGRPRAPADFRSWALEHRAVEMTESQFEAWRQNGFKPPVDWARWRRAGFPIGDDGTPVEVVAAK